MIGLLNIAIYFFLFPELSASLIISSKQTQY